MAEESIAEQLNAQDEHGLLREQVIAPSGGAVESAPGASVEAVTEKTEGKYNELLAKVVPKKSATPSDDKPVDEEVVKLDARHIGAMTDEDGKVQKLVDLAGTKGVAHAVRVARSLKDYYALDRMHDELANRLYQGLLERGLIEQE